MRIDPKYFNRFIFIAALLGAALIALFTWWNMESREEIFQRRLGAKTDTLSSIYLTRISGQDSVKVQQFEDKWVVLDFWASWAPPSRQSHKVLHRLKNRYPKQLVIISVASQDPVNEVKKYKKNHSYDFIYVKGRALYRDLNPPGVPTQIIFGPGGRVTDVITGFYDSTQYNQLRKQLKESDEGSRVL